MFFVTVLSVIVGVFGAFAMFRASVKLCRLGVFLTALMFSACTWGLIGSLIWAYDVTEILALLVIAASYIGTTCMLLPDPDAVEA
ncbi:MAG: hypothetical protein Q8Q39_00965 [bacterium]|nr:hypothetical protein [bacterium]